MYGRTHCRAICGISPLWCGVDRHSPPEFSRSIANKGERVCPARRSRVEEQIFLANDLNSFESFLDSSICLLILYICSIAEESVGSSFDVLR